MSPFVEYLVSALLLAGGGFALVGSFALAKLSRFELRLHGPGVEGQPRRAAVDHHAHGAAVGFAEGRDAEDGAEAAGQGSPPVRSRGPRRARARALGVRASIAEARSGRNAGPHARIAAGDRAISGGQGIDHVSDQRAHIPYLWSPYTGARKRQHPGLGTPF